MNRGPIFVGGLEHSGKTPLRLMLSLHPNIAMSRRTYMWTRFYKRYGDLSQPDNFENCLNAMLIYKHMKVLNPDPERIRREFWQGEPTYPRLFALFHQHYAEQLGKSRWGDQLGFVERYADPIFAAYPTAKMIHMIRDPRDSYEASTTPIKHQQIKNGRTTARWLYSANLARRNQQRYPDRYKVVRYESLIAQREETLREICAFLAETFTPSMLAIEPAIKFDDNDDDSNYIADSATRAVSGDGSAYQMMSQKELAFVQACAKQSMLAYGYHLQPISLSFSDRLLYYLVDWPTGLVGLITWRVLETWHNYRQIK